MKLPREQKARLNSPENPDKRISDRFKSRPEGGPFILTKRGWVKIERAEK